MAGEARRKRLRALLGRAGVTAVDPALLERAFVHESAAREGKAEGSNERLEFLGDAVLGLVTARYLYERYPAADEGELALRKAALVSDSALAATAEALDVEPLLVLGAGLEASPKRRRRSALADALEAVIGTLFLTAGLDAAARFVVTEHLEPREGEHAIHDPKTLLQEWTQKHFASVPRYAERFEGPPHERTYTAVAVVADEVLGEGSGPSKKEAQRAAAARALERLRESHDDVGPRATSEPRPTVTPRVRGSAHGKRSRA